jgi:GrpB-like predicted nucleotidyltransferase (UPF0157 family)
MNPEKIDFDSLTAEQAGKLFPIRIVPYNPDWEILFKQEKALITEALGANVALNIAHVGSTSVEGLAAKPTIDIMVEVPQLNDELKQMITQKLETIGYGNMQNAEQERKMTFGKGYDENCDNTQTYHLHIREQGDTLQDEIYFRDCLRRNPDVRNEYERLKYALAEKYRFNREDYTQAKTGFVKRITETAKSRNNHTPELSISILPDNKYNPDLHHRRSIRLRGYDYSQEGLYFITLCTQNRACLLGEIADGEIRLNETGRMVENEWLKLP